MWKLYCLCCTAWVWLMYPRSSGYMRYCIRQRHLSAAYQLRFWWRDRVVRKPYRTIGWESEFSPELRAVVPYAYWHHLNGTLRKTVSCTGMSEFYFFSPDHEESIPGRTFNNFHFPLEIPNSEDHNVRYDYSKWVRVPWKAHFRNAHFRFAKPLVVVANRYNTEWEGPPVSFFAMEDLRLLFTELCPHFQVIYNRPSADAISNDESEVLDLGEKAWVRQAFPEVLLLEDLREHPEARPRNFNHLQLMVYANCERFISIHGGTATLASCFGGTNIIMSKRGQERPFGEFDTIFPELSGARIIACRSTEEVLEHVRREWPPSAADR